MRCGPWQGWNHPYYGKESVSWRAKHSVSLYTFRRLILKSEVCIWERTLYETFSVLHIASLRWSLHLNQGFYMDGRSMRSCFEMSLRFLVLRRVWTRKLCLRSYVLYEHHSINALCVCDSIHWALLVGICRGEFEAVGLSRQGFSKGMGKPNR